MGKQDVAEEVLLDDELIEKGFNDALDDLQKSLGLTEGLSKAGKAPPVKDEDEPEEDEDFEEEEEEEDEYRKSISDILAEEPEAAAAMDVEPFLLQLAKAIDESVEAIASAVNAKLAKVEKLVKSQGAMTAASAQLQKSTREMVKAIGEQPVGTGSIRRLQKSSRFEGTGGATEVDNTTVLAKSRDWLLQKKIDLVEAGKIEGRINKGLLGKVNDGLDQKVAALMREAS